MYHTNPLGSFGYPPVDVQTSRSSSMEVHIGSDHGGNSREHEQMNKSDKYVQDDKNEKKRKREPRKYKN